MLNLDPEPLQTQIARLWAEGVTMPQIAVACQLPAKTINNLVCRWRAKNPALFPRRRTRRLYMRKDILALLAALIADYPTDLRLRTVRDWLPQRPSPAHDDDCTCGKCPSCRRNAACAKLEREEVARAGKRKQRR